MKPIRVIAAILFALLWNSLPGSAAPEPSAPLEVITTADDPHPHVEGEVLVKFKAGVTPEQAQSVAAARKMSLIQRHRLNGNTEIYRYRAPQHNHSVKACAKKCLKNSEIEYAEPNYILEVSAVPNDPSFGQLWGLHNTGQSGGVADADIDAPEAWDYTTGNSAIVVAVIDTGVEYTHPDLAANMWQNPGEIPGNGVDDDGNGYVDDIYGYDFVNNDNNPMDDHSHGTHCAGTIAAVGNNGTGVVGVSWNAKIMALKFLSASGSGTTSAAISCIQYAINKKAHILSNSWGGGGYSQALSDAITAANNAGILFVAAAGNNNSNNDASPFYPANYPQSNLISVASTDRTDARSSFSNYGATTVDLGAPGSSILSTVLNGGYGNKSGTSMATPHVSGAAALVWGQNPSLTHLQVRDRLLAAVDPIPALSGITVTGGRLNVLKALDTEKNPPAAISDLSAASSNLFSVTLQWTAVGDDANTGTASRYDIRYSTSDITAANFSSATAVLNPPTPKPAGGSETFTVSGMNPSTTYYFAVKAVDDAGNASAISNIVSRATPNGYIVFQDNVESGGSIWTVAGTDGAGGPSLWHITQNRAVSPTRSWYYGRENFWNYDTGATNSGSITSLPISLGGLADATLMFTHRLTTEGNASYDKATVQISTNGGTTFQNLLTKTSTAGQFVAESVNLASYLGSTILLRFNFDTVDNQFNNYEGWYVDDVKVWSSTPDTTPPSAVTDLVVNAVVLPPAGGQKQAANGIESSGDYSADFAIANIADGNLVTFWSSSGTTTMQKHIILDMGSSQTIAKLRMLPRDNYPNYLFPQDFRIQISTDKANWTTVHTVTGYTGQANVWGEWTFSAATGRYVRVMMDKFAGPYPFNGLYYCQIMEAELYASGGTVGGDALEFKWTAVGDDASAGTAASYDVRYSSAPISAANFSAASALTGEPAPKPSGSSETYYAAALPLGKYYFALKVLDEAGNASGISNVFYLSTGDDIAPAAVTDLAAKTVTLPGGSGQKFAATGVESSGDYSADFSIAKIADANTATFWSSSGTTTMQKYFILDMGSSQTIAKLRMLPRDNYPEYLFPQDFRIQVSADKSNWTTVHTVTGYTGQANVWGEWSFTAATGRYVRVMMDKFAGPYPFNGLYYCQVSEAELFAQGASGGEGVELTWTAVGDDASSGTAASYNIRYSPTAITDANFSSATAATGQPTPKAVGSAESFQVVGLNPGNYYFAMKVSDESGNLSGLSNVAFVSTGVPDATAPSAVTTLAASIVNLPGGDGEKFAATGIESSPSLSGDYSVAKLSDGNLTTLWSSAGASGPQHYLILDMGSSQTVAKLRMLPRDYYTNIFFPQDFRVQISADKTNWTTVATVTGYTGQANVWGEWSFTAAPGRYVRVMVDNLAGPYPFNGLYYCQIMEVELYAQGTNGGEAAQLDWTAVGDDGNTGTASAYDIRYSTSTISDANFASATQVSGESAPKAAGSAETFQVTGLGAGTYYFAMKVADEMGNVSGLSNVVSVTKNAAGSVSGSSTQNEGDAEIQVTDLHAASTGSTSVLLAWSASAGSEAQYFDLRHSGQEITESNFSSLPSLPVTAKQGVSQAALVGNLKPDAVYYFALKAHGKDGSVSPLSNVAQTSTQPAGAPNPDDPGTQTQTTSIVIFVKQPAALYPTTLQGLVDFFYQFETSPMFPAGANLFRLSTDSAAGAAEPLTQFEGAAVRDPVAAPDGKKIYFAMREAGQGTWQIFQINPDGSGLAKVSQNGVYNDVEPFPLPDGRVGFASDRQKSAGSAETKVNLYAMNADGSGVALLFGDGATVDFAPRLDSAGAVLFTRLTAEEPGAQLKLHKWDPQTGAETEVYGHPAWGATHVPDQPLVSYFGSTVAAAAATLAGLPFDVSPLEAPLAYSQPPQLFWHPAFARENTLAVAAAQLPENPQASPSVPVNFDLHFYDVATQSSSAAADDPAAWEWMPALLKTPVSD